MARKKRQLGIDSAPLERVDDVKLSHALWLIAKQLVESRSARRSADDEALADHAFDEDAAADRRAA